MPTSKTGLLKYNRAYILADYKEKFKLSKKDTEYLDNFFRGRRILVGMNKKEVFLVIEIYKTTDLLFEQVDKKV